MEGASDTPMDDDGESRPETAGLGAYRWLTASASRRWGFLVLFTLVTRLPILTYPKACDDEQVYVVVAVEMLHGGQPYVSAVERKPPLLFYVYEATLGLFGERSYFALHFGALLWTLATMALLATIVRRLFDARAGFVAAGLYAVFSAWANYTNLAWNGELLMNLPIVAAFALAMRPSRSRLRPELMLVGTLVSVAFLFKQPSVIAGLPLAVYVLHPDYRRARGLGWLASLVHAAMLFVGFAAALALAALYLRQVGLLQEAWYWTISNHATPLGPTTWFFWHKLPGRGALFVLECLPILLLTAISIREGAGAGGIWSQRRAELAAFVVLLGGCVLGVVANGQFNYHYFIQLTPPLVLLSAPVFAAIWNGERAPRARYLAPRFLARWVGLAALVFLVTDTIGLAQIRGLLKSAVYVRDHSTPDDRIFVWGQGTAQTGIYLDAQRRPASRYIASFALNGLLWGMGDPAYDTHDRIVPGAWDNLRREFALHPPKFIIDCHEVRDGPLLFPIRGYPYLKTLLERDYRQVKRTEDGVIYQRVVSP
jgi:4-amino-4-deoxy-L-arabinose transferase-like glycosyltransferase